MLSPLFICNSSLGHVQAKATSSYLFCVHTSCHGAHGLHHTPPPTCSWLHAWQRSLPLLVNVPTCLWLGVVTTTCYLMCANKACSLRLLSLLPMRANSAYLLLSLLMHSNNESSQKAIGKPHLP